MKRGDIVVLSSAGKKLEQNFRCRGGFGIIEYVQGSIAEYPISVKWWKEDMTDSFNAYFKRYEIKKMKKRT